MRKQTKRLLGILCIVFIATTVAYSIYEDYLREKTKGSYVFRVESRGSPTSNTKDVVKEAGLGTICSQCSLLPKKYQCRCVIEKIAGKENKNAQVSSNGP